MKLRHIRIKNFRCFSDIELPLDDTTILIGENNSGKTALLEAIRKALPISAGGRREPFDQYDYHFDSSSNSAPVSQETSIELTFREDCANDWPINLRQALHDIIQTDPFADLNSIHLRLSSIQKSNTQETH
jgi:putative ATP-dependent endonuclease of OLD family